MKKCGSPDIRIDATKSDCTMPYIVTFQVMNITKDNLEWRTVFKTFCSSGEDKKRVLNRLVELFAKYTRFPRIRNSIFYLDLN